MSEATGGAGTSAGTATAGPGTDTSTDTSTGAETGYQPDGYDGDGYDGDGYDEGDVDEGDVDEEEDEGDVDEEEDEDDDLDDGDDLEEVVAEVVRGLLDRVDRAEELSRADVRDLAWLLGPRPAGRLARTLNEESTQRRRDMPRRGFLARLFAAPHQAPDPLPGSIAALLLRIESGQRVGRADLQCLTRLIGRETTWALQQVIARFGDPRRSRRGGRRGR